MAAITTTTGLDTLRVLFNSMKNVYYISTVNAGLAELAKFDMEFPVLSDGVTFNTGEASITKTKLTTGAEWTSVAEAGDSDITFQVASVADAVASVLMDKKTSAQVAMTNSVDGKTYKGDGYTTEPKKLAGGLFMTSEAKDSAIFLPNIEGYSSFVCEQNKPAYFNVKITPLADASGANFYIMVPSE